MTYREAVMYIGAILIFIMFTSLSAIKDAKADKAATASQTLTSYYGEYL